MIRAALDCARADRGGLLLAMALIIAVPAFASGLDDHGADLFPREKLEVDLSGSFRTRGDWLHNLDLDRGTTPSGAPLFAVPLADPTSQDLFSTDMRLRTDVALYAPYATVAVKARIDVLDDLLLGSTPVLSPGGGTSPTPAASPGQLPSSLFRIKRAYAEALTPVGLISAGRMGNQWGLGMLSNGGDCLDCNLGDAADRIAFVTALVGHLWAVAYDFTAIGPEQLRKDGQRSLVLDPSVGVQSATLAVMNLRSPDSLKRRLRAGKTTLEYGGFASLRWQTNDVPLSYLPLAQPRAATPTDVMYRGYRAGAFDVWARLTSPNFQVGFEGALLLAEVEQPSLLPGVLLRDHAYSTQYGAVLESMVGSDASRFAFGLNAGLASGDPAPGFGAFPGYASGPPAAGELDGAQANVPRDARIDNLRFHPDYRVDRILFAEIVGTVTDAMYLRPWARARLWDSPAAAFSARGAVTLSRALEATSTPGGDAGLGTEVHLGLTWESRDGFDVLAEYAVLFPMAGFDNPAQGLTATPAQLGRVRLGWRF